MGIAVNVITDLDALSQSDIRDWNAFAQNPFQRFEWLGSWANAYQTLHPPRVLRISDGARVIGFFPLCIDSRLASGQTLQLMGAGKACTDHLSLLSSKERLADVCDAVADWFASGHGHQTDSDQADGWDVLELVGVDADDSGINQLVGALASRSLTVERSAGASCYAIELPETWDEYVKMRSKSGRREIRQAMQTIDEGRVSVERIESMDQYEDRWQEFIRLHGLRRSSKGTSGCFETQEFTGFLKSAGERLMELGLLRFVFVLEGGRPIAAQFAIADKQRWYFYQSGMDPEASSLRPGLSLFCHTIRASILSELKFYDMMRGDEPYKLRWRATEEATQEIRVFNPRFTSQLRKGVYKTGLAFKGMLRSGVGFATPAG